MLVLALVLGATLASAARAVLGAPGPPLPVLVATRDLPAGHTLEPGDLSGRHWPADLVPPAATTGQAGGTLVSPLPAGVPLTAAHLTADGLAGLLPDGTAAVPVPRDLVAEVDVGATIGVVAVDHEGRGSTLADGARVVAVDHDTVWVRVPRSIAAEFAVATLRGTVALVLLPG